MLVQEMRLQVSDETAGNWTVLEQPHDLCGGDIAASVSVESMEYAALGVGFQNAERSGGGSRIWHRDGWFVYTIAEACLQ